MSNQAVIKPIAYIKNDFKEKFGIPRQSGRVREVISRIVFENEFRDENYILGIEQFSHLWLIFDFSLSHKESFSPTVRPPRLGGNKRIGVYASRSPFRQNSLGLSAVKLEGIEKTKAEGNVLIVSGADLLDGTPIYDIKPYIPYSDCIADAVGGYAEENKEYRLYVNLPDKFKDILPPEKERALISCLAEDPRPSYQDDLRQYTMRFADFDISFTVQNKSLNITDIKKIM